jgi:hypothetical protein
MTKFRLHYRVQDNGDGSASVHFHPTEEHANQAEEKEIEKGYGWGESSVHSVQLKLENNQLFFRDHEEVNGKYQEVWRPVEETQKK